MGRAITPLDFGLLPIGEALIARLMRWHLDHGLTIEEIVIAQVHKDRKDRR